MLEFDKLSEVEIAQHREGAGSQAKTRVTLQKFETSWNRFRLAQDKNAVLTAMNYIRLLASPQMDRY